MKRERSYLAILLIQKRKDLHYKTPQLLVQLSFGGTTYIKLGVVRTFLPNSLLLLQYLYKTVRNQSWCKKPHWNRETLSHDCTNSLLFNFRAQQLRRSLHVAIHVGTKKLFPHQRLHQLFPSCNIRAEWSKRSPVEAIHIGTSSPSLLR